MDIPDRLLSDYKPAMIGGRRGQVDLSDLREIKVQPQYYTLFFDVHCSVGKLVL